LSGRRSEREARRRPVHSRFDLTGDCIGACIGFERMPRQSGFSGMMMIGIGSLLSGG
jgi:hypothetical protein